MFGGYISEATAGKDGPATKRQKRAIVQAAEDLALAMQVASRCGPRALIDVPGVKFKAIRPSARFVNSKNATISPWVIIDSIRCFEGV